MRVTVGAVGDRAYSRKEYVVFKPILLHRIADAGGPRHHSPGASRKVGSRSFQLADVPAESAEAIDTAADLEEPAVDAVARAAAGFVGGFVCTAVLHPERQVESTDRKRTRH